MHYLAVLGRQPKLSLAELESLFDHVSLLTTSHPSPQTPTTSKHFATSQKSHPSTTLTTSTSITSPTLAATTSPASALATFTSPVTPNLNHLGGTMKLAKLLDQPLEKYLLSLPAGKITLGISDYSHHASAKTAKNFGLKYKRILKNHHRSLRLIENKSATLSTATSHHNQLGEKPNHLEIIKVNQKLYLSLGAQNITAYTKRDQVRPARDPKVGMLPPKFAQILINLCGPLDKNATILDPFCGTGVLLQEAVLMGYHPYGTDKNPRMIEYSTKNLNWLHANLKSPKSLSIHFDQFSHHNDNPKTSLKTYPNTLPKHPTQTPPKLEVGDATTHLWNFSNLPQNHFAQPTSLTPKNSQQPQLPQVDLQKPHHSTTTPKPHPQTPPHLSPLSPSPVKPILVHLCPPRQPKSN